MSICRNSCQLCRYSGDVIQCPLLCLFADNDLLMRSPTSLCAWEQCTSNRFEIQHINGTHMWHMSYLPPWLERRMITQQPKSYGQLREIYSLHSLIHGTPIIQTALRGSRPLGYLIYMDGCILTQMWTRPRRPDHLLQVRSFSLLSSVSFTWSRSCSACLENEMNN